MSYIFNYKENDAPVVSTGAGREWCLVGLYIIENVQLKTPAGLMT